MTSKGWFKRYMYRYLWRFMIAALLGSFAVCCATGLLFTSGYLISKSAMRPENILMVYVPIVLVRTFGFGKAVMQYVQRLVGHDTTMRILSDMRVRLYRVLEPQALFIRSRFRTGEMLGLLADDIEQLQQIYLQTVLPIVTALVIYAASVIVLGSFDVMFALWMALYFAVLLFIIPGISLWVVKSRQQRVKQGRSLIYEQLTDALFGLRDWAMSGRTATFMNAYDDAESKVFRLEKRLKSWQYTRNFVTQLLTGFAVLIMIVWASGQVEDGKIALAYMAAFVLAMFPLMDAFLPAADAVERIPTYQESFKRLGRVESMQGEPTQQADSQQPLSNQKAHISLLSVSYCHEGYTNQSIRELTLDIPQGKRIAILGSSGAGKTTLLNVIQGAIVPSSGRANLNGLPIHHFDQAEWFAVLNQSPHLFDTTIANNIRLGKRRATEEEIHEAAQRVKLDPLIASLPQGYLTKVEEMGQRFSGGERQRIALARILLQDTPVVLLDEPTTGLDPTTERNLLATLLEVLEGKTLIWVTHHLLGVEHMDEVIFMEQGSITMRGTHDQLMANFERYRKLYQLDHPFN
ncbi:thiol reductant ABC exporter subunit CydC [Paenibacillus sp. N3.4]|uniref:thiol reductant ABC exporter subunit CydC n=1 Tax=Paenibacillus sp. N3.4 TaxID=2603222 RepID=UPI0011C7DDB1|nr:thiol reductant ABC exporter subunit CydC [Paenibacillus sp. N3.4]TXK85016.1 thiol reductant ABC exporter subunit CydC [Paenibacillus sp. N3.4]